MKRPFKRARKVLELLIAMVACFAFFEGAQAVVPPPDGGYPGGNTAGGESALFGLTTGTYNTAVGLYSLLSNRQGQFNTALGAGTLLANTADENTATGAGALLSNTTGNENTANGTFALFSNTTSSHNTANGDSALFSNTDGESNSAVGHDALFSNTTGVRNIAVGDSAGSNLTTGDDNIDIGNGGVAGESATIRIGKPNFQSATFIAGISGVAIVGGTPVVVGSNGQLGTIVSSQRFKTDIKPMDKASESLLALHPVTFHYKKEIDPAGTSQYGLVAEEVEKVNCDLVVRDNDGKPYTVRYDQLNAMLLNEFLKEHRTVQEQQAAITELKYKFAEQQKQIGILTAGLQKVNEHEQHSGYSTVRLSQKVIRTPPACNPLP
jgi:Chaperone of endosialidase